MAEAVVKLKQGSLTRVELDDLSTYFFPLAQNIARRFARRGREEDFIAAGYFGIAHALVTAKDKMYDNDLESWVKSNIYRFIRRYKVTDHLIPIPNSTMRDARCRGEEIKQLKGQSLGENAHVPRPSTLFKSLLEHLDKIAWQPLDKQILELRIEGYTDKEIAEIIGKSKSDVNRRRVRMEERFKILMGKEEECDDTLD